MYAAIRTGKAKSGSAQELAQRINTGAVPIVSSVRGFKAYYVTYGEDDTVTTVSVFDDQAGAEESNQRMLPWIKQNLAQFLVSPPEAVSGQVIAHKVQ